MGLILQFISWKMFNGNFWTSVIITSVIIIVISYGFELFSKLTGKGTYDFMDAVASVIGGVIGMLLALPLQW